MRHRQNFDQYARKIIRTGNADPLAALERTIGAGIISTPYMDFIKTLRLSFPDFGYPLLSVVIPFGSVQLNPKEIDEFGVRTPTTEEVILFCGQLGRNDCNQRNTLVFPSDPPFTSGVRPPVPCWWTLKWDERDCTSKLLLYVIERQKWPDDVKMVCIAK